MAHTHRLIGNAAALEIWRSRAISAEMGHQTIVEICKNAIESELYKDGIEACIERSTSQLSDIDSVATFRADNGIYKECVQQGCCTRCHGSGLMHIPKERLHEGKSRTMCDDCEGTGSRERQVENLKKGDTSDWCKNR